MREVAGPNPSFGAAISKINNDHQIFLRQDLAGARLIDVSLGFAVRQQTNRGRVRSGRGRVESDRDRGWVDGDISWENCVAAVGQPYSITPIRPVQLTRRREFGPSWRLTLGFAM